MCRLLLKLDFHETGEPRTAPEWVVRALNDLFAGQNCGLWDTLLEVRHEATRIQSGIQAQGVAHVVNVAHLAEEKLGVARGALHAGLALERFLRRGGKLKKHFASKEQTSAATFLAMVQVDGEPPKDLETVESAICRLEAEVAAMQLAEKWADCGVEIRLGRLGATLSQLADNGKRLDAIVELLSARGRVVAILEPPGPALATNSLENLLSLLQAVPAALTHLKYTQRRAGLEGLHRTVRAMAGRHEA